jgi:hypothetical protein
MAYNELKGQGHGFKLPAQKSPNNKVTNETFFGRNDSFAVPFDPRSSTRLNLLEFTAVEPSMLSDTFLTVPNRGHNLSLAANRDLIQLESFLEVRPLSKDTKQVRFQDEATKDE